MAAASVLSFGAASVVLGPVGGDSDACCVTTVTGFAGLVSSALLNGLGGGEGVAVAATGADDDDDTADDDDDAGMTAQPPPCRPPPMLKEPPLLNPPNLHVRQCVMISGGEVTRNITWV